MGSLMRSLAATLIMALLGAPLAALAADEDPTGIEFLTTDDPAVQEVISLPHEQKGDPEDVERHRALAGMRGGYTRLAAGAGGEIWVYDEDCGWVPMDCVYEAGDAMVCREPPKGMQQAPEDPMESCVWQAGAPGRHAAPYGISDLAVTPDGRVWAVSDEGISSFDGQSWSVRWHGGAFGSGPVGLAVAPDGSLVAAGQLTGLDWEDPQEHEGPILTAEIVVVRIGDDRLRVDQLGTPPTGGMWSVSPNAITVDADGVLWIGGASPMSEADTIGGFSTRGFLIRDDGETARVVEPLGAGAEQPGVAALDIAPDGSLWGLMWAESEESSPGPFLARYDGQDWQFTPIGVDLSGRPGDSLAVDSTGTVWLTLDLGGDTGGVASFDGRDWTTYMPGSRPWDLVVAPDDSVWWTGATVVPRFGKEDRSTVGLRVIRAATNAVSPRQ